MRAELHSDSHCPSGTVRVGDDLARRVGVESGRQVLLVTNRYGPALMTVRVDPTIGQGRAVVSPARLARLGATTDHRCEIESRCTATDLTDEEARSSLRMVERVVDGGGRSTVVIAPHGGDIEPTTDAQAERVAAAFGTDSATAWSCRAWSPTAAFARWHVPSTLIHPGSFPLLAPLVRRRFDRSVAFHGCSLDGIVVGGTMPPHLRTEVAQSISSVVGPAGFSVDLAEPGSRYSGSDPENIVNRLCRNSDGSLQIEQGLRVRATLWREIADAVATTLTRFEQ